MRHWPGLLIFLALVTVPWTAQAQDIHIIPVPLGVKPQWTKVPGAPRISWAPNIPTDVFRYRGAYYFFWENAFYRGSTPRGPWKFVPKVPQVFYDIGPAYFKTVKKTDAIPAAPGEPAPPPESDFIQIPPAVPPPAPPEPEPLLPPKAPAGLPKVM